MILMVCCNNPDNGLFSGRAEKVEGHFGDSIDDALEFENNFGDWAPRFLVHDRNGYVRLCGVKVPFKNSRDWYGNWCWNAYGGIKLVDFLALVNCDRFRHCFSVQAGPSELFEAWQRKALTADLVRSVFLKDSKR